MSGIIALVLMPALSYCCETQLKTAVNKKIDTSIEYFAMIALNTLY